MPVFLEITEALQILTDYEDIFTASNPVLYILRILGWWILKGVKYVLDALLDLLSSAFEFLNFSGSEEASNFLATYSDLLVPLMMITLIVIGILMIVGSDQIKGSKLLQNIALALAVLVLLPSLTSWFNSLTLEYADVQGSAMEKGASEILVQNTYDLQYIFQDEDYATRYETKNVFAETENPDGIWQIDINEQIVGNDDDVNSGPNDVFEKTYDPAYPDKEQEIDPTRLVVQVDFLTSWYYRYSVDMIPVIIIYLVYCIVIAATVFKCARLAYEIVVHQLIGMLLAVTDLATAQRIKKVLYSLLSTYIVLMYAITALVLFNVFVQWLITEDLSVFKQAVFIAAIAMAVIDGPKVIELVFGLDAGIGSGVGATLAAIGFTSHVAKAATSGTKSAKEHLSNNEKKANDKASSSSDSAKNIGYGSSKFGMNDISQSKSKEQIHPGTALSPEVPPSLSDSAETKASKDSAVSVPVASSEPVAAAATPETSAEPVAAASSSVTPSEPVASAAAPVASSESVAAASIPVTPAAPVVAPATPVTPAAPTSAASVPVTPAASVVAPATPVTPAAPTSAASVPVTPAASVVAPATPITPAAPTSAASMPVTPAAPVVAPATPVTPAAPTSIASVPVTPEEQTLKETKPKRTRRKKDS